VAEVPGEEDVLPADYGSRDVHRVIEHGGCEYALPYVPLAERLHLVGDDENSETSQKAEETAPVDGIRSLSQLVAGSEVARANSARRAQNASVSCCRSVVRLSK
jgi:hypothetical protein